MARVCDYLEISLRPFVLYDQAIIPDQLTCCAEVPTFRHLSHPVRGSPTLRDRCHIYRNHRQELL